MSRISTLSLWVSLARLATLTVGGSLPSKLSLASSWRRVSELAGRQANKPSGQQKSSLARHTLLIVHLSRFARQLVPLLLLYCRCAFNYLASRSVGRWVSRSFGWPFSLAEKLRKLRCNLARRKRRHP